MFFLQNKDQEKLQPRQRWCCFFGSTKKAPTQRLLKCEYRQQYQLSYNHGNLSTQKKTKKP